MDGLEGGGKRAMMSVLNNGRSQEGSLFSSRSSSGNIPSFRLSFRTLHAPQGVQ